MRVAVLADIHGNLPALEVVLDEISAVGVDAIVLNGDIVTGPMPAQTLARLDDLDNLVWVRGNADREVVEAYDGTPGDDLPADVRAQTQYTAAQLSRPQRDLLAGLPLDVTLDLDGLGPVRFCHATTRNDTEIVLVDSSLERFAECFAAVVEETVVLGHTHMPFDRLADRRRFVNPGSVGMPYGRPGAHWAVLGPEITLRRTTYDLEEAGRLIGRAAPDYPGLAEFISDNLMTVPSDALALAAFSPHES